MHDNLPEVVISKSVSIANSVTAVTTKEYFSGKAVAYLRQDLLKFVQEINIDENNHWPPTFKYKCEEATRINHLLAYWSVGTT